jgi:uncharacterized membrane protein
MSKTRLEAFSDGVIAVAITLLALDLHVPAAGSAHSLGHVLGHQWPEYAAYVVSFATIGIIWINHHAMLARCARIDHTIMVLNLLLLMTIGVLPFSTALMSQYLRAAHGAHLAAAVYGGSFLLMALAFFAMQWQLMRAKAHLLDDRLTDELRRRVLWRNAAGLLPYVAGTLAALASPYATVAICGAVAAFYALPSTTSV